MNHQCYYLWTELLYPYINSPISVDFFNLFVEVLIVTVNETWESNLYFIVNINFFNGSNDLSNCLKRVNFILNVISIGMNDDQIKFLASRRSDVVAPGWNLILTESSLKTSRLLTCLTIESPTIIISFLDVDFITQWFSLLFEFLFSFSLIEKLLLSTGLYLLSLGDLLPITGLLSLPWTYRTGTWWDWWSTNLFLLSNNLLKRFCLLKMPSFQNLTLWFKVFSSFCQ